MENICRGEFEVVLRV